MELLGVKPAQKRILEAISPLNSKETELADCLGMVLSVPLVASRQLPAWDNSAMDGYALRASDAQDNHAPLPIVAVVPAGSSKDILIPRGACARIFTGAPMPSGTDTVMIQENAIRDETTQMVSFTRAAKPGENVRRQGTDVQAGDVVLSKGRIIRPGDIGFAAAQGHSSLHVIRRPEVTIFSTGSELIPVDSEPPKRGQIVNSNVWALAAAVKSAGGIPTILPIVPDDCNATINCLEKATQADCVISCGGMSVGEYDFMRDALKAVTKNGFQFWKVAIKPGKPLGFGQIDGCSIFGLPGNPASAMVTFELFVRPAIRRLLGHTDCLPKPVKARTLHPIKRGIRRQNYLRARIQIDEHDELWVDASRNQSSGALSSTAGVDALVVVKANAEPKPAGAKVDILPLKA